MKYLPSDPPGWVAGRIAQDGALGPFLRGGRKPIDVRRRRQLLARAGFSFGSKSYPPLSAPTKDDWRALSASGHDGIGVCSGVSVHQAMLGDVQENPPPDPSAPLGAVDYDAAPLTTDLVVTINSLEAGVDRLDFWSGVQCPPGVFQVTDPAIFFSLVPADTGARDLFPEFVPLRGVPVLGFSIPMWCVPSRQGLPGQVRPVTFWEVA